MPGRRARAPGVPPWCVGGGGLPHLAENSLDGHKFDWPPLGIKKLGAGMTGIQRHHTGG